MNGTSTAQEHVPAPDALRLLESDRTIADLLDSADADVLVPLKHVDAVKHAAWAKFRAEQTSDEARLAEHREKRIAIDDAVMRYASFVIGERPDDGYPLYIALHGGGGAPAHVNDQQWQHMQTYYRSSVPVGVYVAPRGMTNTYNLHSVGASYPAYDRLIENMILFEGVDPNRVYVLGFSAGGDGVYQIAPRLADRLAAVNMSAGHPNGISLINTYRLPFLLQVGERDTAYNRHRVTAEYAQRLAQMQAMHPDGYVHEANIHVDRGHNFPDNDPQMRAFEVLADPAAWLKDGSRASVRRNTNAVAWLREHVRDPMPDRLIWEPAVRADTRIGRRANNFYWLTLSDDDLKVYQPGETIIVRVDRDRNAIIIEQLPHGALHIHLSGDVFDLSKPLMMVDGERTLRHQPRVTLRHILQSIVERGDPACIFETSVHVGPGLR